MRLTIKLRGWLSGPKGGSMQKKKTDQKLNTAPSQSRLERLVMPSKFTYLNIIFMGLIGSGLGYTGNIVAAVFAIVILVQEFCEVTTRELISSQGKYIEALEEAYNVSVKA
jgi:hypothetical protein